ncbi:MAG TPA: LCP family protein [Candidatus Scatomorpha merdipullorum]|uniref:LCP family protein n=1 Tax=Candidatus Scatomorpha merdipullorum TaxID=2840927 RepID=A0A9D1FFJ6_9FIRM|nr:LCP family protein [Candidatus Scatomorpha merdipullorum]
MHIFGGNGRGGRHSASGGPDDDYYYSDGFDSDDASYDDGEHYDDDYDYDRRYAERMERVERRERYAARGQEGPRQRFESDDIISREERRAMRPRWPRRLLAAFLTLAVLAVGAYAGYRVWAKAPETEQGGLNDYTTEQPEESGVAAEAPDSAASHRDGVYTFLISGIDVVGYHNDTNLVGMFDTVNGKLNIVSLPRDMLVNVNLNIKKINQPYAAAKNNNQDATAALLDTVSDILGYEVDMYAFVNIEAAAEIVDAIGGVYFDIPYDMDWDAPDQDPPLHIHIKAGPQTLDGENFVNAMRFRMSNDGSHTYAGGDIQRIEFQHELLMAFAEQALQFGNIANLGEIYSAVMENTETNVSLGNIMFLLEQFLKLDGEDISFHTIPNRMDGMINGLNYVMPLIDDWVVMLNEYLNPFDVEITKENLNMISYIDGVWTMTQGYIAGGEESFAYFG